MFKNSLRNIFVLVLFSLFLRSGVNPYTKKVEVKGFSKATSTYHYDIKIPSRNPQKVSFPKRIRKSRGIEVDVPKILNPSLQQSFKYTEYLPSISQSTFISFLLSYHRRRGPPCLA